MDSVSQLFVDVHSSGVIEYFTAVFAYAWATATLPTYAIWGFLKEIFNLGPLVAWDQL